MKKASSQTKVLVIMPTLDKCGGIERFFMNYYEHMPTDFKFDIITHHCNSNHYATQICNRGDRLYVLPEFKIKNMKRIYQDAEKIITNNHYDVIHCQMANAGFMYLKMAKKAGVNIRILHSHQCKYADKAFNAIRNIPLIALAKKYANEYAACGMKAGKFMFGKNKFALLYNALDPQEYRKSQIIRKEIRKRYKIPDGTLLLGSIGRLEPQKNHSFSIKIAKNDNNISLLIIGDGSLKSELAAEIKNHKIENRVFLLGSTSRISDYYNAIDALIMPSEYEGLPLVGIEAQFMNKPCYFSDKITRELSISDNCYYLPIKGREASKQWNQRIHDTVNLGNKLNYKSEKYNIKTQYKNLVSLYRGEQ